VAQKSVDTGGNVLIESGTIVRLIAYHVKTATTNCPPSLPHEVIANEDKKTKFS
jgi:hypothetical protein